MIYHYHLQLIILMPILQQVSSLNCHCANSHPCNGSSYGYCQGWFCHYDSAGSIIQKGCSSQPRQRQIHVFYNHTSATHAFNLTSYCDSDYCNSESTAQLNPYQTCVWPAPPKPVHVQCYCNKQGMISAGVDPDLCINQVCTLGAAYRPLKQGFGYCFLKYDNSQGQLEMGCNPLKQRKKTDVIFSLEEGQELQCAFNKCNSETLAKWAVCPGETASNGQSQYNSFKGQYSFNAIVASILSCAYVLILL